MSLQWKDENRARKDKVLWKSHDITAIQQKRAKKVNNKQRLAAAKAMKIKREKENKNKQNGTWSINKTKTTAFYGAPSRFFWMA